METLREQWDARRVAAPLRAEMAFEGGDLVLGAGTRLASPARDEGDVQKSASQKSEARLVALLSAAHRRPVTLRALAHIRRALVRQSEGEATLALIHLALTGLSKLEHPVADARRLFMADGLMREGVEPRVILQALEIDTGLLDELERRYDPDQPRVPAGSGRESGQWTSGDGADAPTDASATSIDVHDDQRGQPGRGVQIADNSSAWTQYLNPIGEAEAATTGRPAFNGPGPNTQHQQRVQEAQAAYIAAGFLIASAGPTYVNVPGFPGPRVYDFVAQDLDTGEFIGVEVKTTQYDAISLNASQVDKDVALLEAGGVYVLSLRANITLVAYETFCGGCWYINLRTPYLVEELIRAGASIRFHLPYSGGGPPI